MTDHLGDGRSAESGGADGQARSEFVERWRDAAYGCYSSGHKFCREVCPVTQVTRNENYRPDRLSRERRGDGAGVARRRRRRRRLRQLHPVRGVRAALPQHAVHRRLLPPSARGRSRWSRRCARWRWTPATSSRSGSAGSSGWSTPTASRCWRDPDRARSTWADWAEGLDLPVGGETVLFVDCEAAFYRTSYARATAQLLQGRRRASSG